MLSPSISCIPLSLGTHPEGKSHNHSISGYHFCKSFIYPSNGPMPWGTFVGIHSHNIKRLSIYSAIVLSHWGAMSDYNSSEVQSAWPLIQVPHSVRL